MRGPRFVVSGTSESSRFCVSGYPKLQASWHFRSIGDRGLAKVAACFFARSDSPLSALHRALAS